MTYDVHIGSSTSVESTFGLRVAVGASSPLPQAVADHVRHDVPPLTRGAQAYFWTEAWQRGELESQEDIEAGRVRVFDQPLDAVRWLLAGDE